jgi:hypothetical protein
MKRLTVLLLCLLVGAAFGMSSQQLNLQLQQITSNYLKEHGKKHGFTAVEVSVLLPNEKEARK